MSILQYFIQREQQELEAASNATDAIARRLHLEMADGYTSRIDEIRRQADVSAVGSLLPLPIG
jgi:hypothetical protein